MKTHIWDRYETDRAYILKLLGFPPFECDAFAHTDWNNLPVRVKDALRASLEATEKQAR